MSQRDATDARCERFEALSEAAAGGAPLTAEDRAALAEHRQRCADCRAAERLLGALRHRPEAPSVDPLDDLAAQRIVNELVAQVDAALAGTADATGTADLADPGVDGDRAPAPAAGPRAVDGGRRRLRIALPAALAAALLLALVLVLTQGGQRADEGAGSAGTWRAPEAEAPGRLLLRTGSVRCPGHALEVGAALPPGSVIEVGQGLAALQVARAVVLRAESDTRVALSPAPAGEAAVRLERGELLAAVTPGLPGARFAVRTPHGAVRVTGTLFGVSIRAGGSFVEVLHGSVIVTSAGGATVTLRGGQAMRIGAARPGALPDARRRALHRRADALALLDAERGATLRIASQPEGAAVRLDGALLGRTPLAAVVRPGHRRLVVAAPRHEEVAEHLLLASGSEVRRDFELRPERHAAASPSLQAGERPGGTAVPGLQPAPAPRGPARVGDGARPGSGPGGSAHGADEGWRALLAKAQSRRAAQDWAGAARAYRTLIARYPGRPEARTAQVSLGYVLLEHLGQPAAALAAFDRYLRAGGAGPLAREAAWGRVKALRALGRRGGERLALQRFLARFPGSVHEARIRARLRELGAPSVKP